MTREWKAVALVVAFVAGGMSILLGLLLVDLRGGW
jgi:hypothetical protein